MAWCCQATSYYLNQCCPRSLSPDGVTRPQWVNDTAWWCYNVVNFFQNPQKRHPIARPLGRGMGCLFWVLPIIWYIFWFSDCCTVCHDDVIKWKHFPRYWLFVQGIHRSLVNSPHKGQWDWALMFSLICARINGWVNNHDGGELRRHRAHYDVNLMPYHIILVCVMMALHCNAMLYSLVLLQYDAIQHDTV